MLRAEVVGFSPHDLLTLSSPFKRCRLCPWCCSHSLPESPEDLPDYPLFISIGDWLDSIKMSQYKSNFIAAGYTTLDSISSMSIEWVSQTGDLWRVKKGLDFTVCKNNKVSQTKKSLNTSRAVRYDDLIYVLWGLKNINCFILLSIIYFLW